jgi:hypothetical protein
MRAAALFALYLGRRQFHQLRPIQIAVLPLYHLLKLKSFYGEFICQAFEQFALVWVARSGREARPRKCLSPDHAYGVRALPGDCRQAGGLDPRSKAWRLTALRLSGDASFAYGRWGSWAIKPNVGCSGAMIALLSARKVLMLTKACLKKPRDRGAPSH